MCKIISLVNHNRLVTICGFPGIGKTTIAKSVGFFLEEREKFSDGIMYISMSRRYQANMLITQLYHLIKKQLSLEELERLNKMTKLNQKQEDLSARILPKNDMELDEAFEVELSINQADLDKIIYCLSEKNVLIIIDNIEDPLNSDAKNLKVILEQLLDKCESIKFLSTSRLCLEKIGNTEESSYLLKELSHYYSVRLFFEKAKMDIDIVQIVELLKADDIDVNEAEFAGKQSPYFLKMLENHSLFKKLSGHPHAISLIAQLAKDSSLVEIY